MKSSNIIDSVLNVAQKACSIDLESIGKNTPKTIKTIDAKSIVNSLNVKSPERVARRSLATLDVAYLLANIDGWFTEKQEACFEKIALSLGKKPSDVSAHAVGLNAKLAHLRDKLTQEELLDTFIMECRIYSEVFDGLLIPSRRAFALWITLGLADGEITPIYRKALELLRQEFKHSALLFGAIGALPVLGASSFVGGVSLGVVSAIAGGLKCLKYKEKLDKYAPLISEDFLLQAERIIAEIIKLEAELEVDINDKKQQQYEAFVQELEDLINPPNNDKEEDDDDEK